jgi:hypothetical protein
VNLGFDGVLGADGLGPSVAAQPLPDRALGAQIFRQALRIASERPMAIPELLWPGGARLRRTLRLTSLESALAAEVNFLKNITSAAKRCSNDGIVVHA